MSNIPDNPNDKKPDTLWKDPYSGSIFLTPDAFKQLHIKTKSLVNQEDTYEKKREAGYVTIQEAADLLQIGYMFVYKRAKKIIPEETYSPQGLITKTEPGVKGAELVWHNPYSPPRGGKGILINPTLVQGWKEISKQQEACRASGYKTITEMADSVALDRSIIEERTRKIKSDKYYNSSGLEATPEDRVLGSELVWRDPYGSTSAIGVLIHPSLVNAWQKPANEKIELRGKDYRTYSETEELTGIGKERLQAKVAAIDTEETYSFPTADASAPLIIKGVDLVWRNPLSLTDGTSVLIHPALVELWRVDEAKEKELRAKNYKTIGETSAITGVSKGTISGRLQKIVPSDDYLPNGLPPNIENTPTIKGSELVWRGYETFLHPELVEAWKAAKLKENELIKQGYKTTEEAAKITNLNKDSTVLNRACDIKPEQLYNLQGLTPKVGEPTIKGKELVWRSPYSLSSNKGILIHPQLVESWQQIGSWKHNVSEEEKTLRAKGYLDVSYIETQYGIARSSIHRRLNNIQDEKDYTVAGLEPKEGDVTVKGKDLYWQNPSSAFILVHPELARAWQQDVEQEKLLISKGFKWLKDEPELLGLPNGTMMHRARSIKAEEMYTEAGLPSSTTDSGIKGKELVRKSVYTGKVIIHPGLVAGWKAAQNKANQLIELGYRTTNDIEDTTGLSKQQISVRTLALKDNPLIWRDPYSNKVLYHPTLVERWQQQAKKQTVMKDAQAINIGEVRNPSVENDLSAILDEKEPKQEKM